MKLFRLSNVASHVMDFLFSIEIPGWIRFSLIIACGIGIGLAAGFFVTHVLEWLGKRHGKYMGRLVHNNMRIPIFSFFLFVSLFTTVWLFYPVLLQLGFVRAIEKILLVVILVWMALRLLGIVTAFVKRRFDIANEDNLRARAVHTQIMVVRRVIGFLIVLLGLSSFFLLFDNLRGIGVSLIASAGVAGIAIGLAAQKTLGNLLAGIQIAITQPIRIDDVVIVENEWGWIEEITLTYVVVRIWDLRRLVVPISYFIEKPFQNWTRTSAEILGTVYLYTDYTMPVGPIREKVTQILENHPKWNRKVNVVQVTECKPETVEIRILVSAKDSPNAWELRCDVREKLIEFVQKEYPDALPKTRAVLQKEETVEDGPPAAKPYDL